MKYFLTMLIALASFGGGYYLNHHQLLNGNAVALSDSLALAGESGSKGTLPKGTVMYPYSDSGEIATYVVFINTKQLNLLNPVSFEHSSTISPVEAFHE